MERPLETWGRDELLDEVRRLRNNQQVLRKEAADLRAAVAAAQRLRMDASSLTDPSKGVTALTIGAERWREFLDALTKVQKP